MYCPPILVVWHTWHHLCKKSFFFKRLFSYCSCAWKQVGCFVLIYRTYVDILSVLIYRTYVDILSAVCRICINILYLVIAVWIDGVFVFVMLTAGLYWNVKWLCDCSSISLHNFFKFGYISMAWPSPVSFSVYSHSIDRTLFTNTTGYWTCQDHNTIHTNHQTLATLLTSTSDNK
jgi:hypothetical protein